MTTQHGPCTPPSWSPRVPESPTSNVATVVESRIGVQSKHSSKRQEPSSGPPSARKLLLQAWQAAIAAEGDGSAKNLLIELLSSPEEASEEEILQSGPTEPVLGQAPEEAGEKFFINTEI